MSTATQIHLIGVPFNSAGRSDGVARAPAALRRSGLAQGIAEYGDGVVDLGDVELGPTTPDRDPGSGIIAPEALVLMIDRVRDAVAGSLSLTAFPVVIGGDCPVLLGCLRALDADCQPGLLFIDGHEDAWPPFRSTTGEAADMELGLALGRTGDSLPPWLRVSLPRLEPSGVVVIGPRDRDELAEAGVATIEEVVRVIRPDEIGDLEETVDAAVERVGAGGDWWLHVDLDVLSSANLSAVDYPQEGGLDWDQLTRLTGQALRAQGVVGWTITIYNPDLDPTGHGAARIVRYVAEALGIRYGASTLRP
jgi:arginase